MNRLLLGKEIKRRRVELKLTQKQLAEGICKQSIISKIENGELFPLFEIIVALSNRLNVSVRYLLESAICEQFYSIDVLKKEVNSLIINHKYEDAFLIADKVLHTNEFLLGEHKEFFVSYRAISAFYNNSITFEECLIILEQCFPDTKNYIKYDQKLVNRNSIAILYAENGNSKKALEELEKLLLEYKNETYNTFYLRVLFNYANLLHNCGFFEKTLLIVNESISVCRKVEDAKMFGKFYFLKGECLIDLGYPKDEISKCFEKALFFFDMLHHDDYIKILWDTYYEYL